MPSVWSSLRNLPKAVWILSGALFVNRAGSMILSFLVLYATRERGFSVEQAGLLVTAFGLGTVIASPLAGRLADRLSALSIMQASLVRGRRAPDDKTAEAMIAGSGRGTRSGEDDGREAKPGRRRGGGEHAEVGDSGRRYEGSWERDGLLAAVEGAG